MDTRCGGMWSANIHNLNPHPLWQYKHIHNLNRLVPQSVEGARFMSARAESLWN
ncbi:hypothetical protein CY34DRAFT_812192 [Suillus luteus UH-Slu-Lm8-n1]|uniref:Uncharacterized protein n=1 Tax=Suillus luteus UH-Slu-Lm8-n1 TaxID=930992 RepID=A0A0C9ZD38_9AGAM|nr:hypothetical protein CY34DRAFT_812192 [Suillus luteus UH-Slu-Lm8-n1]